MGLGVNTMKFLLTGLALALSCSSLASADNNSMTGEVKAVLNVTSQGPCFIYDPNKKNNKGEVWYDLNPKLSSLNAEYSITASGMSGLLDHFFNSRSEE